MRTVCATERKKHTQNEKRSIFRQRERTTSEKSSVPWSLSRNHLLLMRYRGGARRDGLAHGARAPSSPQYTTSAGCILRMACVTCLARELSSLARVCAYADAATADQAAPYVASAST